MENNLELFVNGTDDTIGKIDLYGDEPITLNISIQDIKDISKRNSTFSQNFTIPANKNNNILLNHIFNIGSDSTFDTRKKTPCFLLNDTITVFSGIFQLIKINVSNKNVISYECVVYGESIDFVKSLGESLLTDLDFSELNHSRSGENIINSWYADTKTLGYYYPLIDYGYDLNIGELNTGILSISVLTGTVFSSTSLSLTDTTQAWDTDAFQFYEVYIISGTGAGQKRTIGSNTGITLNIQTFWNINPDSTSVYTINRIDATNPYNTTGDGLKTSIFKPALSNAFLFKKIINNNGYDVSSSFIDSDIFSETIIPFNGDDTNIIQQDIKTFDAYLEDDFINIPPVGPTTFIDYPFSDDSIRGNNRSGLYNNTTYIYTNQIANTVTRFSVDFSFEYSRKYFQLGDPVIDSHFVRFYRSGYLGGTVPFSSQFFADNKVPSYGLGTPPPGTAIPNKKITINSPYLTAASGQFQKAQAGETFWIKVGITGFNSTIYPIYDRSNRFYNIILTNNYVDNYIVMNNYIPKNIKQIDYIKSVITMFNLMVIPDKNNPKKLSFVPRNDYFASGSIKDWTDKVDNTFKNETTFLSELQEKKIKITYKSDKDYYNTNYTDKIKLIYGEYNNEYYSEWINGEKKIEVIFSPTPIDKVFGSKDIFIPKICKFDSTSGLYNRTDHNIRFLRKRPNPLLTQDTIKIVGYSASNVYPYCGHLDHPTTPLIDYNFDAIDWAYYPELTYLPGDNLVSLYWKQYLDEISDKNAKLIKCKIYLTPNDIATFNYNDSIYIDGLTDDGGHYFYVNKITYSPTSNLPSTVELIKTFKQVPFRRRSFTLGSPTTLGPVKRLEFGFGNNTNSVSITLGDNNNIGTNSNGSVIFGSNNTIDNNLRGINLINSNNVSVVASASNLTLIGVTGGTFSNSDTTYIGSQTIILDGDVVLNGYTFSGTFSGLNNLEQTLAIGDSSGIQNISMGTTTVIKSDNGGGQIDLDYFGTGGEVSISTDNGGQSESYVYLTPTYAILKGGSGATIDLSNNITMNTPTNSGMFVKVGKTGLKIDGRYGVSGAEDVIRFINNGFDPTTTFTTQNSLKPSVSISSQNSTINAGIPNGLILGGSGNTLGSTSSVISGDYVSDVNGYGNLSSGQGHFLTGSFISNISGQYHNVSGIAHNVSGSNHNVSGFQNTVGGQNNSVSGTNQLVNGNVNNVSGTSNIVSGGYNIVNNSQYNIVSGGLHNLVGSDCNNISGLLNSLNFVSSYNSISGYGHTLYNSSNNGIYGDSNHLTASSYCNISGIQNSLTASSYNNVSGSDHQILNATHNNVSGNSNSLYTSDNNNVSGILHTIYGSYENIVGGYQVGLTSSRFGLVVGYLNTGGGSSFTGQYGSHICSVQTTNAGPGGGGGTTDTGNNLYIPVNSSYSLDILGVAVVKTTGSSGAVVGDTFKFTGTVIAKNIAGTTTLVGSGLLTGTGDTSIAVSATVVADNATDTVLIRVTPSNAGTSTINWSFQIRYTSVLQ